MFSNVSTGIDRVQAFLGLAPLDYSPLLRRSTRGSLTIRDPAIISKSERPDRTYPPLLETTKVSVCVCVYVYVYVCAVCVCAC